MMGFIFIATLFAFQWWMEVIAFPLNLILVASVVAYFGYIFAKQFNKLASVVSCPHCQVALQPQVDAAKIQGIVIKYCPFCGGSVEA